VTRGLPAGFPPDEKCCSLYEGIKYQEYWKGPGQSRQDALERYIISDMLPVSGRRVIDLGCGYGRLTPCYVDRFDQVVLCDGSLSLLREAQAAVPTRVVLVAADIARLPFRSASFDCVLAIRVFQHVRDLQGVLDEVRRITAVGGRLVFSYHNKRNANRILRHVTARGDANPFSRKPAEIRPTLISRHPRTVDDHVRNAGFSLPQYQGSAVIDSLAGIIDKLGRHRPAGARWASFMGRFRLAPWLIGTSVARGGEGFRTADAFDDLFQCPLCGGDVGRSDLSLECSACHRQYPVADGIVDFRL